MPAAYTLIGGLAFRSTLEPHRMTDDPADSSGSAFCAVNGMPPTLVSNVLV